MNSQIQEHKHTNHLFLPSVWGSHFWFTLHNGAAHHPLHASPIVANKMKNFLLSFPYMIPCDDCANHAKAYIDKHIKELDMICSGRHNLFKFFVDMHNMVNKRFGKPIVSLHEAYELYNVRLKG